MTTTLATALVVCLVSGIPLLPADALAGGPPRVQRGLHARGGVPTHGVQVVPAFRPKGAFGSPGGFPFARRPHHDARPLRHKHFPRFLSSTALYTPLALYAPSVDTSPPDVVVSPVIYASPTVYVSVVPAQPAPAPMPARAESALPSVVEHSTGRYELRGDGGATPYVWVWIPYPPPVPPAEPSSSPAAPPPTGATKTYRWTDNEGTTFLTNRLERIPEPYRSRVERTIEEGPRGGTPAERGEARRSGDSSG